MSRIIIATCGALAIAGLTISAQAPQPPATTTPQARTVPDPGKTLSVTGCLKTSDMSGPSASAPGAPPTASARGAQYVLTDAEHEGRPIGTAGSPGTPGATPGGSAGQTHAYFVKAEDGGVSLSQHLNHKIEVTGTLDTAPSSTPGGPDPDAPGRTAPKDQPKSDREPMQTILVTGIKMVSPTCS